MSYQNQNHNKASQENIVFQPQSQSSAKTLVNTVELNCLTYTKLLNIPDQKKPSQPEIFQQKQRYTNQQQNGQKNQERQETQDKQETQETQETQKTQETQQRQKRQKRQEFKNSSSPYKSARKDIYSVQIKNDENKEQEDIKNSQLKKLSHRYVNEQKSQMRKKDPRYRSVQLQHKDKRHTKKHRCIKQDKIPKTCLIPKKNTLNGQILRMTADQQKCQSKVVTRTRYDARMKNTKYTLMRPERIKSEERMRPERNKSEERRSISQVQIRHKQVVFDVFTRPD